MSEIVSVTITIITVAGILVGVYTGLLSLKKPHLSFSIDKAKTTLFNEKNEEENISLLIAYVANKRKHNLGDVAKGITACVCYRAPDNNTQWGLNASIGLPWLENFTTRTKIPEKLKSQEDIVNGLEKHLFTRKEVDLPQGRTGGLAVAFGIERTNSMFLASNPPIEIQLPSADEPNVAFAACFIRLEVAGENIPSTLSEGTVIVAKKWNEWTFPTEVEAVSTPSSFKNMLLRLGIGKRQKVIEVKTTKN